MKIRTVYVIDDGPKTYSLETFLDEESEIEISQPGTESVIHLSIDQGVQLREVIAALILEAEKFVAEEESGVGVGVE